MNRNALFAAVLSCAVAIPAFAHEPTKEHAGKSHAVQKEQKPWGIAGDAKAVTKTIRVTMGDNMRFTPETIDLKQGDVVKFVVGNGGKLMHEMVIGTKAELDQHSATMAKHPGMEHDEPYMAHVSPGKKENLVWNFNRAGEFDFACLVAGHYEAGMRGKIRVAAR
jgi:uncharacterized cupredoxin-like copper-binding protein